MRLATVLVCAALLSACESVAKNPTPVSEVIAETPATLPPYLIGPGDELEVVFFHTPELNIQTPVRPDGYISMPLAHDVRAAGRTPEELRTILTQHYVQELKSPEIAVVIRAFAAYKVHVGGEVEHPGVYPLTGSMTVLDALFLAGVVTRTARLDEILVIRPHAATRSYKVIPINIKRVIDGTDTTQNIALGPFDAVYVPTSPIADVNTFVDLYIRQNIPIDVGLRFGDLGFD
jgi:protein involved in polysaccharide export with SLBB domain